MEDFARIGRIIHFLLNSKRLTILIENFVVSIEEIKKALRIEKIPVSAREALSKTIYSFNSL